MKKICVVTSTRADYGPLKPLIHDIQEDVELELQLVVMGTHFSSEFGCTINDIHNDGIIVTKEIDTLLTEDDAEAFNKGMGQALIEFSCYLTEHQPQVVIVLGDRCELLPIVLAANVAGITVAHLSGGELTEGAIDDNIRHAITKMSNLHFTSMETFSKRILQMGENPIDVFTVGELGLDNLARIERMSKSDFELSISHKLSLKNILITYHPETTKSIESNIDDFSTLINELGLLSDTLLIFTFSNADVGGRKINEMIKEFVKRPDVNAVFCKSLGQKRFISALGMVDLMIGNSSSGIWEASSFYLPVINIGDRQKGRIYPKNVINIQANSVEIKNALQLSMSAKFINSLKALLNPYGDGKTSKRIIEILKSRQLGRPVRKTFTDIEF
jgi:UDP-hydrolysing UDP-N-acetyl-D-glucosamine 2-epimerase